MKRSCMISLRMSIELLDKLEKRVKENKFLNVSEAIRSFIEIGMYVDSYKTIIKDPEFLKSIKELKQTEGIFHWLETLEDSQMDAIATAIKMEKEKRFDYNTLR